MTFSVRFTQEAQQDIQRLFAFILERDASGFDTAERALNPDIQGVRNHLQPFWADTPACSRYLA